jgi:hypothetical protein
MRPTPLANKQQGVLIITQEHLAGEKGFVQVETRVYPTIIPVFRYRN